MRVVTIGEFILARVADDEFLARHIATRRAPRCGIAGAAEVARIDTWDPARVLAQCSVRRKLVVEHRVAGLVPGSARCGCGGPGPACPPCLTMRALALEWADHPDYEATWRPHPVPRQVSRSKERVGT